MEIRIEDSFETLDHDEWDKYLGTELFKEMRFEKGTLGETSDFLKSISAPRLHELIQDHNNKIGSLEISYALCKHYYDKGIPDDPWYISPGKNGSSIQYFPMFSEEHWMRKYWFNYFADTFYLKISAAWDSIIEIIDEFYQYGIQQDLRFRSNVFKKLKDDNPALLDLFNTIQENQLYKDAQKYRTAAAHGTSAGEISNTIQERRNVEAEIPEVIDGKLVMKKVRSPLVVSFGVGEYTNAATIMKNIEDYSIFSGSKMQEIIKIM